MQVRTEIVAVREIGSGQPVGYGATWKASRPSRIATIPMGYADGLSRAQSNTGAVLVRGRRAPIVGRVSMDYTTVDVGGIQNVGVGDTVTLIGSEGGESIGVEEVARHAQTIAYEITCSVGKRVERICVGGDDLELPAQRAPEASAAFHPRPPAPVEAGSPRPRPGGRTSDPD